MILEQERYRRLSLLFADAGADIMYVGQLLCHAAQVFGDRIAVTVTVKQSMTYKQLYQAACLVGSYMRSNGFKPRERVIILYENSIDFYIIYFAVLQIGGVVVPVNTYLHERELQHIIKDAQASVVCISRECAQKLSSLTGWVITQDEVEAILRQDKPTVEEFQIIPLAQDELAVLLYTSGTTGLPKGVMLSSTNIMTNVFQGASRFDYQHAERMYCALPLFHSFTQNTCIWSSFALGFTVILVPKMRRTDLLRGLQLQPTIILGVPGLFALFCLMKGINFRKVRYFISGGDALPDKIRMWFSLMYGRSICNGYGLSETSPFVAVDLDDVVSSTNTVGRPFVHMQCEIREGSPIGVLWIKGPNVMLGYYNAPQATCNVLQDGWLNTGDLARIDQQGKLVICGREKDLIVVKGVKIYPQEVENILLLHPSITQVAVVGIKMKETEVPVAFLVMKEPINEVAEVMTDFCRKHIAVYKIPRHFVIRDELPLTATGKVDKKILRSWGNKHTE